jgi:chromosome segregation ATPase
MLANVHTATTPVIRVKAACIAFVLAIASYGCKANQKAPECAVLVPAMSELGERLAAARGVLAEPDVEPTLVAEVLKPFSDVAKKTATKLVANVPNNARLRAISDQASTAANALGVRAAQMAEYATQMTDIDAVNKAVDDEKQRVDKLESQIRQLCEADSAKCVDLSGVLARFPAPTDQNGVDQDMTVWARKLAVWTNELAGVEISDQKLRGHVNEFQQGWRELGAAMSRLAAMLSVGKKYEEANREFNAQIEQANKAIAATNAACHKG